MQEELIPKYPVCSKITLGLCLGAFLFGAFFTLFPAYFPLEAEERGFSSTLVGMMYITQAIFSFFGSAFSECCQRRFGRKWSFVISIMLHVSL